MMILALLALICALIPTGLFLVNLRHFRPPPLPPTRTLEAVSVLIPARNEAATIGGALQALRHSDYPHFEVVVLDDHSEDATAAIVQHFAADDPRIRLESAPPLPPGWCGKQHACAVLAERSRFEVLCFVDADVRLQPDALTRSVAFLQASGTGLVSGFPRQIAGTWLERWLIPLIHFVLLGFLPLIAMRRQPHHPGFGAACGQWIIARREAYKASGGHRAIRNRLHDGIHLPRLFRRHGFSTDLFDATHLATCRMYDNAADVWAGLAKNATEGLGSPTTIGPFTVLLGLGQVAPPLLFLLGLATGYGEVAGIAGIATVVACLPRWLAVRRFAQPWDSALLHPVGVLLLLVIQWQALIRYLQGHPARWKGRDYTSQPPASADSSPGSTPGTPL